MIFMYPLVGLYQWPGNQKSAQIKQTRKYTTSYVTGYRINAGFKGKMIELHTWLAFFSFWRSTWVFLSRITPPYPVIRQPPRKDVCWQGLNPLTDSRQGTLHTETINSILRIKRPWRVKIRPTTDIFASTWWLREMWYIICRCGNDDVSRRCFRHLNSTVHGILSVSV